MRALSLVSPQAVVIPRIFNSGLRRARAIANASSMSSPMSVSRMTFAGLTAEGFVAAGGADTEIDNMKTSNPADRRLMRLNILETKFEGELNQTRIVHGLRNLPKVGGSDVLPWQVKLCMIKQIEELGPEFQVRTFTDTEVLYG